MSCTRQFTGNVLAYVDNADEEPSHASGRAATVAPGVDLLNALNREHDTDGQED